MILLSYTYDGDGNRLEKSSGKIYWYGGGTEILDESDTSGNFTNEYVFFGGKRVAMRVVSSGTIYYYEDDMLGSARTMVQAGQTSLCYDADFYPFGGERDITTSCGSNYKFEGKERDTETGNDDFGARYYISRLGRWLSADWSSVPAPVPCANLTNPQTLNLYAMVSDNPETFADLDGHVSSDGGPYNLETGDSSAGSDGQGHSCDKMGSDCTMQENANANVNGNDQDQAQQQNSSTPAPTNPDGTPAKPPVPPAPGANGKPNDWVRTPGENGKPDQWDPRDTVPNPKGGQPRARWDEKNGHWDIDDWNRNRTRYLPDGTKVDHNNRPIPLSTVEKVGFWTTAGAVTVRVGVAIGRAVAACVESGACEAW